MLQFEPLSSSSFPLVFFLLFLSSIFIQHFFLSLCSNIGILSHNLFPQLFLLTKRLEEASRTVTILLSACTCRRRRRELREPFKYYFADFVRKGGGVPPKSVTPFLPKKKSIREKTLAQATMPLMTEVSLQNIYFLQKTFLIAKMGGLSHSFTTEKTCWLPPQPTCQQLHCPAHLNVLSHGSTCRCILRHRMNNYQSHRRTSKVKNK